MPLHFISHSDELPNLSRYPPSLVNARVDRNENTIQLLPQGAEISWLFLPLAPLSFGKIGDPLFVRDV